MRLGAAPATWCAGVHTCVGEGTHARPPARPHARTHARRQDHGRVSWTRAARGSKCPRQEDGRRPADRDEQHFCARMRRHFCARLRGACARFGMDARGKRRACALASVRACGASRSCVCARCVVFCSALVQCVPVLCVLVLCVLWARAVRLLVVGGKRTARSGALRRLASRSPPPSPPPPASPASACARRVCLCVCARACVHPCTRIKAGEARPVRAYCVARTHRQANVCSTTHAASGALQDTRGVGAGTLPLPPPPRPAPEDIWFAPHGCLRSFPWTMLCAFFFFSSCESFLCVQ